jgi:hypothetical protein
MLRLAAATDACAGRVALSDMAQGLPTRAAAFDAAISVSAVQWLCAAKRPEEAVARFFAALGQAMRPGTCAVLQVYTEDDAQTALLLHSASAAGFDAGFFVDFPHNSSAKKYFVCLHLRASVADDGANADRAQRPPPPPPPPLLSTHSCNIAWPRSGSCVLRWTEHLAGCIAAQQQEEAALSLTLIRARMQQEHATFGRRALRLLRRATAPEPLAAVNCGGDALEHRHGWQPLDRVVAIEAEVQHHGLTPCGGAVVVHITLLEAHLAAPAPCSAAAAPASNGHGGSGQANSNCGGDLFGDGATIGWEGAPDDDVDLLPAAAEVVARSLGPGAAVLDCSVRPAPADVAAQLPRSWPAQLGSALRRLPPAKEAFFWVEPLWQPAPAGAGNALESAGPGAGAGAGAPSLEVLPGAAVLCAQKLPQQLVLCMRHDAALGAGGERQVAAALAQVSALCAKLDANLVAVDLRCSGAVGAGITSAWLLYVAGMQGADREELDAEVKRHFRRVHCEPPCPGEEC